MGVRGYTLVTLLAVLLVPAVPAVPLLCECVFFSEDLSRLYIQRRGGGGGGGGGRERVYIHNDTPVQSCYYTLFPMKKVPGCCCVMHLPCYPQYIKL